MSRNTDAAVTSASQFATQRFRLLVNVQSLTTGTFYACTGDRFIYTMGNTYSPIGHLGGIAPIQEDSDPFPRGVRAWISLVNTAAVTDALAESLYRKPGIVHRLLLSNSYTVQGTPQIAFNGLIDRVEMDSNDERGNYLEVEFESRLIQAPLLGYLTREIFQNAISTSSDTLLDYMNDIRFYIPAWGRAFAGPQFRGPTSDWGIPTETIV